MMYFNLQEYGTRIRKERESCGLTQEALSERLHISRAYLSKMETGKCSGSVELLVAITCELGVSTDYLTLGKQPAAESVLRRVRKISAEFAELEEELKG
jgi:transcriptional regulator with XRE-family HTH domain